MRWYYYLHTNGDLIGKNPAVVDGDPEYFDSSFVRRVWCIDTESRLDAWRVLIEALGREDIVLSKRADRIIRAFFALPPQADREETKT